MATKKSKVVSESMDILYKDKEYAKKSCVAMEKFGFSTLKNGLKKFSQNV